MDIDMDMDTDMGHDDFKIFGSRINISICFHRMAEKFPFPKRSKRSSIEIIVSIETKLNAVKYKIISWERQFAKIFRKYKSLYLVISIDMIKKY